MLIVCFHISILTPWGQDALCAIRPSLVLPGLISAALPHILIAFHVLLKSVRFKLRALPSNTIRSHCSWYWSSWFYINQSFSTFLTKAYHSFLPWARWTQSLVFDVMLSHRYISKFRGPCCLYHQGRYLGKNARRHICIPKTVRTSSVFHLITHYKIYVKVKQPHYWPRQAPRFVDNRHMKVVRLSALRTGRLYPPGNIPGTHFC
jgi:ABC-type dipeptide/oligopeptide/nickel transport system permease component